MKEDIERSDKAWDYIKKVAQHKSVWKEFVVGRFPEPG